MTTVSSLKGPSAQRKAVVTRTVPQWRVCLAVSRLCFPSGSVERSDSVLGISSELDNGARFIHSHALTVSALRTQLSCHPTLTPVSLNAGFSSIALALVSISLASCLRKPLGLFLTSISKHLTAYCIAARRRNVVAVKSSCVPDWGSADVETAQLEEAQPCHSHMHAHAGARQPLPSVLCPASQPDCL
jgi:hypothetical protein